MGHVATVSSETQDVEISRERIKCLKQLVDCKWLAKDIKRRGLDKRLRKCPSEVMVWFTISLWFAGDDNYCQVYRWLHRFSRKDMPSSSALTQARARMGVGIFRSVFHRAVGCLCTAETSHGYYAGLRMVAIDGFVLDLPDSLSNRRVFGRPKNGTSEGAFPQVRIVALCEVGSHVFFNFLAKPLQCNEVTMAKHVIGHLPEKSLLFFDIGFCATVLMKKVLERDSHFVGRCKVNRCFEKLEQLPDGSYLSKIYANDKDRLRDRNGRIVRVIDYTLDDPQRVGHQERHRIVTSLLDPNEHPAQVLITLYHERWEEEISIDEIKTHMRGAKTLRSRSPSGVIQEIYSLMLAHFATRKLAFDAAVLAGVAPQRISFTGTLKVLRVNLVEAPRSSRLRKIWHQNLIAEASLEVLEPRRNRINPRVIKGARSKWPTKRDEHRNPQHIQQTFEQTIRVLT